MENHWKEWTSSRIPPWDNCHLVKLVLYINTKFNWIASKMDDSNYLPKNGTKV